jgi:hypothetical protein
MLKPSSIGVAVEVERLELKSLQDARKMARNSNADHTSGLGSSRSTLRQVSLCSLNLFREKQRSAVALAAV